MKIFLMLFVLLTALPSNAAIMECVNAKGATVYTNDSMCPKGYAVKSTEAETGEHSAKSPGYATYDYWVEFYMALYNDKLKANLMANCRMEYSDSNSVALCQSRIRW